MLKSLFLKLSPNCDCGKANLETTVPGDGFWHLCVWLLTWPSCRNWQETLVVDRKSNDGKQKSIQSILRELSSIHEFSSWELENIRSRQTDIQTERERDTPSLVQRTSKHCANHLVLKMPMNNTQNFYKKYDKRNLRCHLLYFPQRFLASGNGGINFAAAARKVWTWENRKG